MKLGFIGYRGFVRKLGPLFRSHLDNPRFIFYHPNKNNKSRALTSDFSQILACDVVVIASPDKTHVNYLKRLKDFRGYIFCEKIPAIDSGGLKYIEKLKNNKLYFNFAYRKGNLAKILENNKNDILYFDFVCGFGLGFRKAYFDNWRSKASSSPLGVFQTSGIHIVDLLLQKYGNPLFYKFHYSNLSQLGTSLDNFYLSMALNTKNRLFANLYFSYTSPFIYEARIITTKKVIKIEHLDLYKDSLVKSVKYFCDIVRQNGTFKESKSPRNLLGNKFFLQLQKDIKRKLK